jgi:hypothetical protein
MISTSAQSQETSFDILLNDPNKCLSYEDKNVLLRKVYLYDLQKQLLDNERCSLIDSHSIISEKEE